MVFPLFAPPPSLALVDVAERKLVEHVLIGGHTQCLLEDFGLLRPAAFQISNFRLQEVLFHGEKLINHSVSHLQFKENAYIC